MKKAEHQRTDAFELWCDGQGSMVWYSLWGHKESDTSEQLN